MTKSFLTENFLHKDEKTYLDMASNSVDSIVITDKNEGVRFLNPAAEALLLLDVATGEFAATEWHDCFDAISDGVLVIDRNFRVLRVNKAAADLLGVDIAQAPGQACYRLVHGSESPPAHCPLNHFLSTGELLEPETDEPHLGCIFQYSIFPIKDNHGAVLSAVEIIKNVEIQKKTETENLLLTETLTQSFAGITEAMSELVEIRDPYTAGHSRGVARWAEKISLAMGLKEDALYGIRVCAILHDIGKIAISSNILSKPGKLSENEWRFIVEHPKLAHEILCNIPFPWPVAEVVYQHHERLNGTGYPQGLKGNEIHPWARILAVADVMDAMITHRPYRAALPSVDLINELNRGRGKVYDEAVVDIAVRLLLKQDRRVLVVDDEPHIIKLIKKVLKTMDIDVQGFSDPCKAIEAFRKNPSPVVITDLSMPVMSGLELLAKIREVSPASNTVIVTGHGEKELAVEALRLGASDFLEKPIQMDKLKTSVENLLRRYHEEKQPFL